MSIRIILVVVLITLIGAIQAKRKCDPSLCSRVRCAMADKNVCEKRDKGVYIERNVKLCRCCSSCAKRLNEGEDCTEATVMDILPKALCAPGLVCSRKKVVCVRP